jgi:hypothetical protein
MTATAIQGEWTQSMIPMAGKGNKKIKLRLRSASFEREIAHLPADLQELRKLMIDVRKNQQENIYMAVAVWSKLRQYDRYWVTFGFSSEAVFLISYDLPEGGTLAAWYLMVTCFDKDTFCLLGDTVLRFMMRGVAGYQTDASLQKRDYQAIFDKYCAVYDGFDKEAFCSSIQLYLEDTYVKPELEKQQITREEWARQNAQERKQKLVHTNQRFTATTSIRKMRGSNDADTQEPGFQLTERKCPTCIRNAELLKAALKYIADLQKVIHKRVGKSAVPDKPKLLADLL